MEVNFYFIFSAGQWVDFFIPGVEQVGGFSMCSSPKLLRTEGQLDLAIKYSQWPPAYWIHTKAKVGDRVGLRFGKYIFLEPYSLMQSQPFCCRWRIPFSKSNDIRVYGQSRESSGGPDFDRRRSWDQSALFDSQISRR